MQTQLSITQSNRAQSSHLRGDDGAHLARSRSSPVVQSTALPLASHRCHSLALGRPPAPPRVLSLVGDFVPSVPTRGRAPAVADRARGGAAGRVRWERTSGTGRRERMHVEAPAALAFAHAPAVGRPTKPNRGCSSALLRHGRRRSSAPLGLAQAGRTDEDEGTTPTRERAAAARQWGGVNRLERASVAALSESRAVTTSQSETTSAQAASSEQDMRFQAGVGCDNEWRVLHAVM
jgi:hypothetical protein